MPRIVVVTPPCFAGAMDADLLIARLAAAQHGVVGRKQLLSASVPPHVIDHRVSEKLLVILHRGVYRTAASRSTWHQRIMAATLAAGPGAVASHRAAAYLHGLNVAPVVEVTVSRARAPRSGFLVHRQVLLPPDVEVRDAIRRTRPPATIIGLAGVSAAAVLESALDDALTRGLVSCDQVRRRLERAGQQGRAGAGTLAALLDARSGLQRWTQSEFERRLLALLGAAGLPLPVPQFEVRLPDGRRAFLDFAWPELRLALEADSYRHHAARQDWARDHVRNNLLIAVGWRILPVTWDDLVGRPADVVALCRRARAA